MERIHQRDKREIYIKQKTESSQCVVITFRAVCDTLRCGVINSGIAFGLSDSQEIKMMKRSKVEWDLLR